MIKLNEHGLAIWKHKTIADRWVERHYEWCDKVLVLQGRKVLSEAKFSEYDFTNYNPVTTQEYQLMLIQPKLDEKMEKLLRKLATDYPIRDAEEGFCLYCYGPSNDAGRKREHHTPDCPWVEARLLLGDNL